MDGRGRNTAPRIASLNYSSPHRLDFHTLLRWQNLQGSSSAKTGTCNKSTVCLCFLRTNRKTSVSNYLEIGRLWWSRGSVLAFGTQVRVFKPRPMPSDFFFRAKKKSLCTPSFGREVKPSVRCRIFTACKRSLNVTWKSGIFRQNSLAISCPSSSSFHY